MFITYCYYLLSLLNLCNLLLYCVLLNVHNLLLILNVYRLPPRSDRQPPGHPDVPRDHHPGPGPGAGPSEGGHVPAGGRARGPAEPEPGRRRRAPPAGAEAGAGEGFWLGGVLFMNDFILMTVQCLLF